jgi:hypothetical protein
MRHPVSRDKSLTEADPVPGLSKSAFHVLRAEKKFNRRYTRTERYLSVPICVDPRLRDCWYCQPDFGIRRLSPYAQQCQRAHALCRADPWASPRTGRSHRAARTHFGHFVTTRRIFNSAPSEAEIPPGRLPVPFLRGPLPVFYQDFSPNFLEKLRKFPIKIQYLVAKIGVECYK